ncbi:hypothetical protein AXK11_08395 [Cephaloticoccus primus]|uniref:Glutathionylspermidine synthase pre-ATP-grasp-like domain-containing protein n=1 Tax=Cephaloticoccus primus TaxID=1548207 RepID=A0A139SIU7_9BACT|nr:hypothetical protein [Cephaloticoccus primus]KXU34477.1 hypothetical protein AXK11_08395 [Cephaloticoccus primus]
MPEHTKDLDYTTLKAAFAAQPLFEDKTWQLSPEAWPLSPEQVAELEQIGAACLEFHHALEKLYLRSASGKSLLRNRALHAPWVVDYLERGKPAALVEHMRDPRNAGAFPTVLRPDLLLTDEGFVLTELDSVPGGIGLTAFLNRLYASAGQPVLGQPAASAAAVDTTAQGQPGGAAQAGTVEARFYESLAALRPELPNPRIALVVSEESATYRPEMQWLAEQLQLAGKQVVCLAPEEIFPLENALFYDVGGTPEKLDILYRFFELFDLPNIPTAPYFFNAWKAGELAIAPPMRAFQEEKLALALFHHHRLADYWQEALSKRAHKTLKKLIPESWVLDPAPLPPGAVLDGPHSGGRPISDWRELGSASQKERDLIIKVSGYHETAWGARSVTLGADSSREDWAAALDRALALAPESPHVLQRYKKPRRARHPLYDASGTRYDAQGRLRLCPYYFVKDGQATLSGALATFCPPDKKIIHGMQDAALLPCRVSPV